MANAITCANKAIKLTLESLKPSGDSQAKIHKYFTNAIFFCI